MSNGGVGTLISDLDGVAPTSDTDLVLQIMNDINAPTAPAPPVAPQMQAPPMPMPAPPMMNAGPMPNTMLQNTIDPNVATAHIIGNRQPSPADFAAMMNGLGSSGFAPVAPQQQYMPQHDMIVESKGVSGLLGNNWLRELKTPILVAIIFCVMSLPVINVMIGHYFPRLLRIGGDLTMSGLGVKSLMAGALFFVIQRVLVPLVTN